MEVSTNKRQNEDENFKIDSLASLGFEVDEDDDDDTGDYNGAIVSKKRKRIGTEAPDTDLNRSKQTNARIKAEGSVAFILDEGTSSIVHHQSSRVFGTFGRGKCDS
mgnify:CR=1 FL=1